MAKARKKHDFNDNWEAEIASYDDECHRRDHEFLKNHFIIDKSGSRKLTEEENEVLTLYLDGMSFPEIAKSYRVETDVITSLMEIIRLKLSLDE